MGYLNIKKNFLSECAENVVFLLKKELILEWKKVNIPKIIIKQHQVPGWIVKNAKKKKEWWG